MRGFSHTAARHSLAQAGAQPDLPEVKLSQRTGYTAVRPRKSRRNSATLSPVLKPERYISGNSSGVGSPETGRASGNGGTTRCRATSTNPTAARSRPATPRTYGVQASPPCATDEQRIYVVTHTKANFVTRVANRVQPRPEHRALRSRQGVRSFSACSNIRTSASKWPSS